MSIIYFFICLGASIIGAISGIGGGVIIKPLLDAIGMLDVATISFLSGCTVLSMTIMTLYRSRNSEVKIDRVKGTWLAIGAAIGGIIGKQIFDFVKGAFPSDAIAGATQSFLLVLITVGVLVFTLKKEKIIPHKVEKKIVSAIIGFFLGAISAFLGIGGGPINLAVLYFFFAMDTRTSALNSIYIIFFSQLASLIYSILSGSIPTFEMNTFLMMIAGGVLGGTLGPAVSKKLSLKGLDKLYITVIIIIIAISMYNGMNYVGKVA